MEITRNLFRHRLRSFLAISGMVRWIHRWFQDGRLSAAEIAALFADYALNLVGFQGKRSF